MVHSPWHGRPGEGPDLVPGDGFLLQQGGSELGEGLPVAGEQVPSAGFRLGQQRGDFLVDQPLGVLGVTACGGERGIAGRRPAVADRTDRLAQAELADHLRRQGGRGGQVVGGAGGRLTADQAFGGPAAQADGEGVGQVPFPVESAVVGGEHLGESEGLPGAQHGDPADRVGVPGQAGRARLRRAHLRSPSSCPAARRAGSSGQGRSCRAGCTGACAARQAGAPPPRSRRGSARARRRARRAGRAG